MGFTSPHHIYKPVKKISGVLGPGARFRVILDRKYLLSCVDKSLIGTVIDVDKCRYRHACVQLVHIHNIAVIL